MKLTVKRFFETEEQKQKHMPNIQKFCDITNKILDGIEGEFIVEYIIPYSQFDVKERPETITQHHIGLIEESYPNAFIYSVLL